MFNRERAKQLFEKSGRTKKWTADECGVDTDTLSSYFRGDRNPSRAVVLHMTRIWDVPESDLMATESDQNNVAAI